MCTPVSAGAQTQPDWAQIETVTVKGEPGPAVWHLTRGTSEVWLLGTAGPLPKGMAWNKQYVAELFDGAHAILFPAKADVSLVDVGWFLIRHGGELRLPHGQTLEAGLSEICAPASSRRATRWAATKAIIAAISRSAPPSGCSRIWSPKPMSSRANRDAPSRIWPTPGIFTAKPVSHFEAMDAVRDILKLSPDQQRVCLSQAVDDVRWALAHSDKTARAWAVGDIQGLKANFGESRFTTASPRRSRPSAISMPATAPRRWPRSIRR